MTDMETNALIAQLRQRLEICDAAERGVLEERLSALITSLHAKPEDRPEHRAEHEAEHDLEVEAMFDNMPV